MEIFGIGPLEFIFILLIAFIVLGPKDIAKTGRTIGRLLRKVVTSQWWRTFRHASREISQLPYTLMREASIEEASNSLKEVEAIGNNIAQDDAPSNDPPGFISWTTQVLPAPNLQENPGTESETLPEGEQKPPPSK
jgi:Sec-independent protein translocase protein TatA